MRKKGKRRTRSYNEIDDLEEDNDLDLDIEDDSDDEDNNSDEDFFDEDLNDNSDNFSDGVMPMEKHNELLRDLTNFEKYLKIKINGWLGLTWDYKEGRYVNDPNNEPIMNKKCADWCIDYLRTYARDNNIVTNLNDKQYSYMVTDIIDVLWLNLGLRMEEFGIRNHGDILRVCTELEHASELAIMGAEDGKYSKLLTGTYGLAQSGNINHDNNQTKQKKQSALDTIKKAFF